MSSVSVHFKHTMLTQPDQTTSPGGGQHSLPPSRPPFLVPPSLSTCLPSLPAYLPSSLPCSQYIHLSIYLHPASLSSYILHLLYIYLCDLSASLFPYLPTCLSTYLPTYLPFFHCLNLPTYLPTYMYPCFPIYLPSYVNPSVRLPAYLLTFLPATPFNFPLHLFSPFSSFPATTFSSSPLCLFLLLSSMLLFMLRHLFLYIRRLHTHLRNDTFLSLFLCCVIVQGSNSEVMITPDVWVDFALYFFL